MPWIFFVLIVRTSKNSIFGKTVYGIYILAFFLCLFNRVAFCFRFAVRFKKEHA